MVKKLICFGLAAVAALTLAAGELHPETQTFLAGMPSGLAELQTKAIREAIAGNGALLKQVRNSRKVDTVPPSGVTTEELSFEGLPIRLYRTPGPVRVLVLYLHGGGWVLGGIPSCSRFCGALAEQEEVAVAACDYRLAPEHPYPAALDDTVKFYDWAKQRYPGARIILAGDSAGGNLAVAAALRLLDKRKKTVDGLILFYPVASLQQDRSESWKKYGKGYALDSRLMEAFNDAYVPDAARRAERYVSPLGTDLKGLPKTLLITSEYDILRDQGEELGRRMKAAGVDVRMLRFDGAPHIFISMPGLDTFFDRALKESVAFTAK